jgi:SAM-dependent methyltransferase
VDLIEIPEGGDFARHPWEVVRAQFFADVQIPVVSGHPASLLDAGSGDGWFARRLADRNPGLSVTCFDPGYEHGAADRLPSSDRVDYVARRPAGPFDVLTLLDVLEHVEDDASLLRGLAGSVRPGGHVLVSVPAWPALFSRHDVALKHFRRYAPRELAALLDVTGLEVSERGGLFHLLLAPRGIAVAAEHLSSRRPDLDGAARHSLEWRGGALTRSVLDAALTADTRLSRLAAGRGLQLPGLSCWALCRRP